MTKKRINLDKEYHCSTDNNDKLSIETGRYIIEVKGIQLLDIICTSCKKLIRNKSKQVAQSRSSEVKDNGD